MSGGIALRPQRVLSSLAQSAFCCQARWLSAAGQGVKSAAPELFCPNPQLLFGVLLASSRATVYAFVFLYFCWPSRWQAWGRILFRPAMVETTAETPGDSTFRSRDRGVGFRMAETPTPVEQCEVVWYKTCPLWLSSWHTRPTLFSPQSGELRSPCCSAGRSRVLDRNGEDKNAT